MYPYWTESYIILDNLKFHYTRTGKGDKPTLILLHGFSDNGMCWMPVARALEEEYDVILPDARGHGLSARVDLNEPIDNAGDVAALIMALGLQKPLVGGHSMGGSTATELAAGYPELIRGLVLEDPAWIDPAPDDTPPLKNPIFEWLMNLEGSTLEDVIAMGKANSPTWPEIEFQAWAESKLQLDKNIFKIMNVRKPWRDFVPLFTIPTLLITADIEKNALVTPEAAQEAAALSPLLQVASIPNAGHNIRRENFPAFMEALQAFLNQFK